MLRLQGLNDGRNSDATLTRQELARVDTKQQIEERYKKWTEDQSNESEQIQSDDHTEDGGKGMYIADLS
jgi:hypothetical protein